jgi:hypothetical protein
VRHIKRVPELQNLLCLVGAEVTPCSLIFQQRLGGTCCSDPEDRTVEHLSIKLQAHQAKGRAYCLVIPSLLGLLFDPKDGGYIFIRNVSILLLRQVVRHSTRQYFSLERKF